MWCIGGVKKSQPPEANSLKIIHEISLDPEHLGSQLWQDGMACDRRQVLFYEWKCNIY